MSNSKTYEGMFLVQSGSDFHAASQPVSTVLERSNAEILAMNPWEERRLAYEIKGHKRGLYILTYFKMDPANLSELHRDSELNEGILRMLILRRDKITEAEINAQTPAQIGQRQAAASEAAAAEAAATEAAAVTPSPETPETPETTPVVEDGAPTVEEKAPIEEEKAPTEEKTPTEEEAPTEENTPVEAFDEAEAPVEVEIIEPDNEPQNPIDEVDTNNAEPKASDEA